MANITALRGRCLAPYLDLANFPDKGGFMGGRFCSLAAGSTDLYCCLPCPLTDWIYSDSFKTWYQVAESLSAVGLFLMVFLLLSYIVLPAEKTRRHYLSVCLVVSIILHGLSFVIPLAVKPPLCFDEITPNDMYSDLTCAWTGAFIIAGGLGITMWIFIRALSMHLQICWDIVPGKRFFYAAQGIGWGVVAALFTVTITITGVSYRFGDSCQINAKHSTKDFWGPILGLAGGAALMQVATFLYCIHVYLKNLWSDEKTDTNTSSGLPSYTSSLRMQSARAVYRRVRKVVWLQWRGMLIVMFLLADVLFFAITFLYLNEMSAVALTKNNQRFRPWINCLLTSGGQREKCFEMGQAALVNESTNIAILMLLSLSGWQTFLLLSRSSLFTAWGEFFRRKISRNNEFVSLDARRFSTDARTFELLKYGATSPRTPETMLTNVTSPSAAYSPAEGRTTPDYYRSESRRDYKSPTMSFSAPRAPSQANMHLEWDPRSTHARGGLRLHPPMEDDDGMANKI